MRRLDGVSAFLLACEKPGAFQHTLKIGIYDTQDVPGGWSYQSFRDDFVRHLPLSPILRWKLQRVPFNLHRALWVDDPDFDIDYHLRHIVCPAPGDNRALCALGHPEPPAWTDGLAGYLAERRALSGTAPRDS